MYPDAPGIDGAALLRQGLALRYDTREHGDYTATGFASDLSASLAEGLVNAGIFAEIIWDTRVLVQETSWLQFAARGYWRQLISGGAAIPFYDQASLGGELLLRGFPTDRFIDTGAWEAEMEQRIRLFQTHIFGVDADWRIDPFVAVGQVYGTAGPFSHVRVAAGAGLRMWVKPNVLGRVDVAYAGEGRQGLRRSRLSVLSARGERKDIADELYWPAGWWAARCSRRWRFRRAPSRSGPCWRAAAVPLMLASMYRLLPLALNTLSWHALLPGTARPPFGRMLRLRWIGESINQLLPVAQIGGDFARARLLAHGGVSGADATAAMVADLSVGAGTQVVFTLMGVAVFAMIAPTSMFGIERWRVDRDRRRDLAGDGGRAGGRRAARRRAAARGAAVPRPRPAGGAAGRRRRQPRPRARRRAGAPWRARGRGDLAPGRLGGAGGGDLADPQAASARTSPGGKPWSSRVCRPRRAASRSPCRRASGFRRARWWCCAESFGIDLASALALGIIKRGRELVVGVPAIVAWAIAERHAIANFWRARTMKERRRRHRSVPPGDGGAAGERSLRVGVLVDLHWTPTAGGHVKTWERLAAAALASGDSLDLTVHFLGTKPATHALGPHVRYRIHTPLFSSANLPFLSHIPDHTDLAPHNPLLTSRLLGYDIIHTTDGAFAAARTAARVARWNGIPLTSSVHTTTPYYTRVFTAATIERLAGKGRLGRLLLDRFGLAGSAEARMQRLVDEHHRRCAFVLASRTDDRARLSAMLGEQRVGLLRRGIERQLFDPARRDRPWLEAEFDIARGRQVVISVGRLDRIKNVLVLAQAIRALADRGVPVHLLCPGKGPDKDALVALLGDRVTCPGVLSPDTLARAYASADLCAQPAVIEELSNAVLEASSSGLAAAGGGGERQRALRRRRRDRDGRARRRRRRLGRRHRRAGVRSGAARGDAPGRARLVADARPELGAGAGRGSAPDLGAGPASAPAPARRSTPSRTCGRGRTR